MVDPVSWDDAVSTAPTAPVPTVPSRAVSWDDAVNAPAPAQNQAPGNSSFLSDALANTATGLTKGASYLGPTLPYTAVKTVDNLADWVSQKLGGKVAPAGSDPVESFLTNHTFTPSDVQGYLDPHGVANYQPSTPAGRIYQEAVQVVPGLLSGGTSGLLNAPKAALPAVASSVAGQEAARVYPNNPVVPLAASLLAGGGTALGQDMGTNLARTGMSTIVPNLTADANASRFLSNAVNAGEGSGNGVAGLSNFISNSSVPMTLADSPNAQLQALAGSVARNEGGREIATSFLNQRDQAAPEALKDAISNNIAPQANSYAATQALTDQQKAASAPLYEAFRQNAPVPAEALQPFVSSPTFQGAVKRANTSILDEGGQPILNYFDQDENGNITGVKQAVTPDALDRIKQGLDDQWMSAKSSGDAGAARTANALRTRFLSFMDNQFPSADVNGNPIQGGYATARNAYSGPAQSKNAIDLGSQFATMKPDEISTTLSALGPSDQQNFRLGMASAMNDMVDKTAMNAGNEAARIGNNTYRQNQIKAAFDNPDQAQQFIDTVNAHNRQFQTKQAILGNSATQGRYAADLENKSGEGGISVPLAAEAFVSHGPVGAGAVLGANVIKNALKGTPLNTPTAAKLAGILYNPNADQNLAALSNVAQGPKGLLSYTPGPLLMQNNENSRKGLLAR